MKALRKLVERQLCPCPCCGQPNTTLGKAHPTLADTLVILLLIGRTGTVRQLVTGHKVLWEERIQESAMANRMVKLTALGLVQRKRQGKFYIYTPTLS